MKAMTDIFEATEVWSIALPGLGRVYLNEHNSIRGGQTAICKICKAPLTAGEGCRFKQERFSAGSLGNGFLCPVCIKHALQGTAKWQWNDTDESLFRAHGYTQRPIDGERLADLWMLNGAAGLMAGIREALEESKQVVMKKG
jgi:hypothetical protein